MAASDDDDVPLSKRLAGAAIVKKESKAAAAAAVRNSIEFESKLSFTQASSDEDDVPLSKRLPVKTEKRPAEKALTAKPKDQAPAKKVKAKKDDDDVPLSKRVAVKKEKPATVDSSDEDDVPLSKRLPVKAEKRPAEKVKKEKAVDGAPAKKVKVKKDDDDVPLSKRVAVKKEKPATVDSSDEDDIPLSKRLVKSEKRPVEKIKKEKTDDEAPAKKVKVKKDPAAIVPDAAEHIRRWWEESDADESDEDGEKWRTLEHQGVWFPPPYEPHGVQMMYDGKPVILTPHQEEIATFYASMLQTPYVSNPVFNKNFFRDWKRVLGPKHVIQELAKCDFTPIYNWVTEQREAKKKLTTEEKKAKKEEGKQLIEKYGWAIVDGHKEKVGNFRMEIPGLFRGRGAHPKAGLVKARIMPEQVTLNLGEDAPVPQCPLPGHDWKEVVHNHNVQWLAMFHDPISNHNKYVWFANSSSLKGKSDRKKFETARKLKDHIDAIRATYRKKMKSSTEKEWQLATAIAIIDLLALRVGNEKDSKEEADTVGCCSLRAEHIKLEAPSTVHFDFLGKDSIRYQNTVQVDALVFHNLERMYKAAKGKRGEDERKLFSSFDTTDLNSYLKAQMEGLTAKVFRTYNASITLQRQLVDTPLEGTVEEKLAFYNKANREVAILCNHQKSVSKNFDQQMARMQEKVEELKAQRKMFKKHLAFLEGKRSKKVTPMTKKRKVKKPKSGDEAGAAAEHEQEEVEEEVEIELPSNPEAVQRKIEKLAEMIRKAEFQMQEKDSNKTVALGTSKINYLDPRITVAWCKKHKVPITKIFTKSLIEKFPWAMAVDEDWTF